MEVRGDVIFFFGNELEKEENNENGKSFGNELESPNINRIKVGISEASTLYVWFLFYFFGLILAYIRIYIYSTLIIYI
jgi:positive regulator of sigma E activity